MSVKQLEEKYMCSYSTIQRALKREGYKLGKTEQIKYKYIRDNEKSFVEDWENGELSLEELELKYKCPKSNLKSRARELNIYRNTKTDKINIPDLIEDYSVRHLSNKIILEKYDICQSTLNTILKENNIDPNFNRKYYFDKHYFDEINDEHKAYWLGFIYADGSHNVKRHTLRIVLQERDAYILKEFYKDLKCDREIGYAYNKKYNKFYAYAYVQHRDLSKVLLEKGVMADKSFKIRFPDDNIVPKNLKQHFIRGYFDGDGCLSAAMGYGSVTYSLVGNYEFIYELQMYLYNNVPNYTMGNIYSKGNVYEFGHCGRKIVPLFLNWLYSGATIYLKRKYDIYQNLLKYNEERNAA